jgi:hypothetical protein
MGIFVFGSFFFGMRGKQRSGGEIFGESKSSLILGIRPNQKKFGANGRIKIEKINGGREIGTPKTRTSFGQISYDFKRFRPRFIQFTHSS